MNKEQEELLLQTELYVTDFFKKNIHNGFAFHNLDHTKRVVDTSKKILRHYFLKNDDRFALLSAAWFHDTGFSSGKIEGHENISLSIAESFLKNKVSNGIIKKVTSCIRATQLPQKPATVIEKIICDADLYHLGTTRFPEFSKLLKKEMEDYFNKKITDEEWSEKNIQFLSGHKYFTEYCKQHLEPVKQKWLEKLQGKTGSYK